MTPIDLNPPVTKNETQKSLHTAQLSSNLTEPPGPTATFLPCLVRVSFGDGKTLVDPCEQQTQPLTIKIVAPWSSP